MAFSQDIMMCINLACNAPGYICTSSHLELFQDHATITNATGWPNAMVEVTVAIPVNARPAIKDLERSAIVSILARKGFQDYTCTMLYNRNMIHGGYTVITPWL